MERKFTDKEKLTMLFDYYKSNKNSKERDGFKNKNRVFNYFIDLCGFNGFPKVLSNSDFEKLECPTFYRGVENVEHNANTLADFDYHYGYGMDGNGIYSSGFLDEVRFYAKCNPQNVMTFKFDGNFVEGRDLIKYIIYLLNAEQDDLEVLRPQDKRRMSTLKKFYNSIKNSNEKDEFKEFFIKNPSFLPVYLGYDAQYIHASFIIFNRSSMVVSQSEHDRICNLSKNYKGGVIDFESKTQEEFLHE